MASFKDLSGQAFGRLKAISRHEKRNNLQQIQWVCECECGSTLLVSGPSLRSGNTKSCGCYGRDVRSENGKRRKTHGMSDTVEYKTWFGIKTRCYNTNDPHYDDYGGRGIEVCNEWMISFEAFYRDMGPRPSPEHSVDRIDNSGNYEPGNCRWATRVEQANNKRNNRLYFFDGEMRSLSAIAKLTNLTQPTLWSRLNRMKLTIDEAVEWNPYRHKTRNPD